jgi:Zn-dependent protease/CBS domain-containing protein
MKWSIPMGRVWGIPIRMHLTFILLLAWIAWLGWSVDGLRSSLWALALIICLFACVVLHELGHSFVAMRFGAHVSSVTLLPIGGVASMRSIPEKPYQELLVSLAGPSVNVLIALVLMAVRGGYHVLGEQNVFPMSVGELVDALVNANLILAVFNLIPAFPMDGGRVLRSVLALFLPFPRATAVAATLGQILAVGFVLVGLAKNPFLVVIGIFIFFGAETEERTVRVKNMLRDVMVEDVMVTDFVNIAPGDTVARCLENVYHRKQEDFVVEFEGRLVGIVARKDWLEVLHSRGPEARVEEIMRRHFITVIPKTPLSRLYQDLWHLKQGVFPVVENGKLVGLLTTEDVSRFLMVQAIRQNSKAVGLGLQRNAGSSSRFTVDLG